MTNKQVIKIWRALNEVQFGEVSVKFTIKKAKMKKKLDEFIEPFKEVDGIINELSQRAKALLDLDNNGNPIINIDGMVSVIDGKEEEFEELDNKLRIRNKERQELLEEESDIELGKLPLSEFPDKMEDKYTEALLPIIEEEE